MPAWSWFWALEPPVQAALIAATVGALASALTNLFAQRRLERLKARLQSELEGRKAELQSDLERVKAELQAEASLRDAWQSYQFEARKRLYAEVEPLLFQLFEAAEGAYHRVASLVRTQRQGNLGSDGRNWLASEGYYFRSTLFRLFLPLSILRLIQRSATLVDLHLDPSIHQRYRVLKECFLTLTDDFGIANIAHGELGEVSHHLCYDPNHPEAEKRAASEPGVYRRQGLFVGYLDRIADAMIVSDGDKKRPINFGEFDEALEADGAFRETLEPSFYLIAGFNFDERPVLARMFVVYAILMNTLLYLYRDSAGKKALPQVVDEFIASDEASQMLWWGAGKPEIFTTVRPYVHSRLKQAVSTGDYVKF